MKGNKLNKEVFIDRSNIKHNHVFNYELVEYVNVNTKVKIICPIHGEFEQKPNDHLNGRGCSKCSDRNLGFNGFVEKSKIKHHDKFNYELVEYVNVNTKVKIVCPIHGEFEQTPHSHLKGYGCNKCGGRNKSDNENFINKAKIVHDNKYDYSLVDYTGNKTKIEIMCPIHGSFKQSPNAHLTGQGCPICKESKGEREINGYLTKEKINFIRQYKFLDCRNILPLPFDFYLTDLNVCIEFDGRQHFKPIKVWGGDEGLKQIQINDKIKTEYCVKNKIKLIRINYKESIVNKLCLI